jgi:hypothetical protein
VIPNVQNPTATEAIQPPLTSLVDRLRTQTDVNRPGQTARGEFAGLLADLMQSLDAEQRAAAAPAAPAPPPLPPAAGAAADAAAAVMRLAGRRYAALTVEDR